MALDESEFNEAVDVPAKCPFIDLTNKLVDRTVRHKNRLTMVRLQKAEHSLKCLHVTRT